MTKKNANSQLTESSGNVFADLELPNADKYLAKAELARQINAILDQRGLKQVESAKLLHIDQPKISALRCGRLDGFSIERLIGFLNLLDRDVEIVIKKKHPRRKARAFLKVANN